MLRILSERFSDIRVLAFDIFGTVVDWRSGVVREVGAIARERSLVVDPGAVADDWRRRYRPAMDEVREGRVPWAVMDELHRGTLREVIRKFSLDALTEGDIDRLVLAWHHLPPWPDASAGLSEMRDHYTLTTLSNGGMALLVDLVHGGHLPFDCVLSTELVRSYKPDPRVYQLVPSLLGVRPVMMVAAHADDLSAARGQGLRTAFVRRPQEWGTGRAEDPDFPVDIKANDFHDLAEQLRV
ncbi:MAG: haloacid dehalogenase type II [Candidatus Dormibacteraeota bacterium]|nr:haloacid dehalogenase type II [Candidatus Dormibacteraeota bacterium]